LRPSILLPKYINWKRCWNISYRERNSFLSTLAKVGSPSPGTKRGNELHCPLGSGKEKGRLKIPGWRKNHSTLCFLESTIPPKACAFHPFRLPSVMAENPPSLMPWEGAFIFHVLGRPLHFILKNVHNLVELKYNTAIPGRACGESPRQQQPSLYVRLFFPKSFRERCKKTTHFEVTFLSHFDRRENSHK